VSRLQRWALCVSYDGYPYHGFQCQNAHSLPTIQTHLERALSCVANHSIGVTCAGRTDSGVHASAQIIHFDTTSDRSSESWVLGTNGNLPSDISVAWAKEVDHDFHARYKALERTYRYVIYNNTVRHSLLRRAVTWHNRALDIVKMQQGADFLIGKHDFSSFRGSNCQADSPIREIHSIKIVKYLNFIILEVKANAFLHHMVRNIVGALYPVGSGLRPAEWINEVLHARDRKLSGVTAAPNGLYLVHVKYDPSWGLPEVIPGPLFLPPSF
jgi:tRNA pseudouridine38-40 synthase